MYSRSSVTKYTPAFAPAVGDIAEFIENGNSVYKVWTGTEWDVLTLNAPEEDNQPKMTAYDINRQIIGQMEAYDADKIHDALQMIGQFVEKSGNGYFMMLNNETRYYTVFVVGRPNGVAFIEEEVVACAEALGQIKLIDLTEDAAAIEIWITNKEDTYVYYFFPYDLGVIECQ